MMSPVRTGENARKLLRNSAEENVGLIDLETDTFEQRIDFLIEMWKDDNCEATLAILKWQKQIAEKFYKPSE